MRFVPHKYQSEVYIDVIKHRKYMLCLDMGLGKTVITLSAIRTMQTCFEIGAVLVIAPLSVARNTWSSEVEKWEHLKGMRVSLILGTEHQRINAMNTPADLYVINRENTQWLCKQLPDLSDKFTMIVIDESSSFKDRGTQRFKAIKKAIKNVDRILLLTGTPSPNGYEDLWAQYYLLDNGERLGKSITAFREKYFHPLFGSGNIVYKYGLNKGADKEITQRIADITRSMKAKDYISVPDVIFVNYPITFTDKVMNEYRKFTRDLILSLADADITAQTAVALSNKLHQYTSGAVYDEDKNTFEIHDEKLTALKEIVEAAQASGESVLIFYQYKHEVKRITEILKGFSPILFTGEPNILQDWNDGKAKVLIAHPASVSYGLNMQRGGHVIIWYSLTWSLEQYQQANARLHRQGQTKSVRVYHLTVKSTIDEKIASSLQGKSSLQDELLKEISRLRTVA